MKYRLPVCCITIIYLFTFLHTIAQPKAASKRSSTDSLYAFLNKLQFRAGQENDLRKAISALAKDATAHGLQTGDYPLSSPGTNDSNFTSAAVSLLRDLFQGRVEKLISYDEIAHAFAGYTDSVILSTLVSAQDQPALLNNLIPDANSYRLLSQQLLYHSSAGHADTAKQLAAAVNIYRWIKHFRFSKYIVVNIPAANMRLYNYDSVLLEMKVVVGKPSTRTPRFSSWLDKVVLYPYWNVPASIATKELLPVFKRAPSKVAQMNMQILDKRGRIMAPNTLNWKSFHRGNFPYTIRQCTGCDNALGVLKFNLTDPFSVYMHDTNNKPAFTSDYRYLSHGCIRVSRPVDLGNALLNNKLDTAFLTACLKNEKPQEMPLAQPIPVFVVYATAEIKDDSLVYYKDIYRLFR